RAGTLSLRKHLEKKRQALVKESLSLAVRIPHEKRLSTEERAVFYSSWVYSAVHLFTSLHAEGASLEDVATRFQIPKLRAREILQFLASTGLVEGSSGSYKIGTRSTHIPKGSPYLLKHHSNWRLKALAKSEGLKDDELMFSGQYSLSRRDFAILREQIAEFLKNVNLLVKNSASEDIAALNIDWFWID
ncbi:MAG: DUF4423 domain-containing protein, partial [Bdellovibrionales bacterium]